MPCPYNGSEDVGGVCWFFVGARHVVPVQRVRGCWRGQLVLRRGTACRAPTTGPRMLAEFVGSSYGHGMPCPYNGSEDVGGVCWFFVGADPRVRPYPTREKGK